MSSYYVTNFDQLAMEAGEEGGVGGGGGSGRGRGEGEEKREGRGGSVKVKASWSVKTMTGTSKTLFRRSSLLTCMWYSKASGSAYLTEQEKTWHIREPEPTDICINS